MSEGSDEMNSMSLSELLTLKLSQGIDTRENKEITVDN
jgi:hypothetical protein